MRSFQRYEPGVWRRYRDARFRGHDRRWRRAVALAPATTAIQSCRSVASPAGSLPFGLDPGVAMTAMLPSRESRREAPSIAFDGSWGNPMSASFTVFVCSTFDDLEQEREAVLDAVRRVQSRHNAMEFFGARPGRPIDVCLEEVRKSDLLVVIVGLKYGSVPPGWGFVFAGRIRGGRAARETLPRLSARQRRSHPGERCRGDPDKLRLLEAWKQTLNARHTVAKFENWPRLRSRSPRTSEISSEDNSVRAEPPRRKASPRRLCAKC